MPRLRPLIGLIALALTACRASVPPWGTSLNDAKHNADNALAALAFRFYSVQRDAKFTVARPRMARYALVPSGIYNDTSVWTVQSRSDSTRALFLQGTLTDRGYTFSSRATAPVPDRLGDERHMLQLTKLGDGEYEWVTAVDHAVGPVRADEVGDVFGTLFTVFEGRSAPALRDDVRNHFSRTARHMHQLFTITSLETTQQGDGSTAFQLAAAVTPDSLRAKYPAFAAYIDKYIMPTRARMRLADRQGVQFADLNLDRGMLYVKLRARNGELVSLTGPPRPRPDTLRARFDLSMKMMLFHVGYTNLAADFIVEHDDHARGWFLRFRKEPEWDFPLAVDKLIRSALRRPFEGRGTELRLTVRDDLGRQAISQRQVRTAVQESAIVRWLGGLGSSAFGDFSGRSEAEENRFLTELFGALRDDVSAIGA